MKIKNLEIKKIRGIKNIKLTPNCDNVVVFGPNGTGKSAIVDSIDFLLTGKMSRLTGEGTKGISLKEHGCHVDSRESLQDVLVEATIELDDNQINLERSMNTPSKLKIKPKKFEDLVKTHLALAQQDTHILSRKEILQYITSEAGKRSEKIMDLLDLTEINTVRSMFVTTGTEAKRNFKRVDSDFNIATGEIIKLLSLEKFSEEEVLKKINSLRTALQGPVLKELRHDIIKDELKTPLHLRETNESLTTEQIKNYIQEVKNMSNIKEELNSNESELKELLQEIIQQAKLKQYSQYIKLLESGIGLVDETNICPLCERPWDEGNFKEHLEKKKQEIEVGKEIKSRIDYLSLNIKKQIDLLNADINVLINTHAQFGLIVDEKKSKEFIQYLDNWSKTMETPLEIYESKTWPKKNLDQILTSDFTEKIIIAPLLEVLHKEGEKYEEQMNTWDTLTKMEDRWKKFKDEESKWNESKLVKDRAQKSLEYFEKARDTVLDNIYGTIQKNFDEHYKTLHSGDEDDFASTLSQDGASLNLEVPFYDRGMFPPHALHSEGHQDSMGLCLFLALNKYLTEGLIQVVVLDDVVMSIDRTHRRAICRLLKEYFPDKQFIITTHDSAWAKQLKSEGVVQKSNMIHFLTWNVETGPTYELEEDLWEKIETELKNDNVPSAAHILRRNAEYFFEDMCDLLSAKINYKGNHQWDLGDYAQAAISAYKGYLKSAISSARKIEDDAKVDELNGLNEDVNKVISASQVEQWIINKNVHYNKWEEFSKNDFKPVVVAFKDLFGLFNCSKCGQFLYLTQGNMEGSKMTIICGCGEYFWNVEK